MKLSDVSLYVVAAVVAAVQVKCPDTKNAGNTDGSISRTI
jgi:hypothetical protein